MKKNEFAKKSRKLFSAILAGAMLTTSVIPEAFVWAADAEAVQGFGDSESMGFESTPDSVPGNGGDGENQELSDFKGGSDIQNGNEIVDMEEGFTDEIASFGSNGSDIPVESGFQSQASVEELQERINALPTVEEFQNLADGTTVEGSTLNQAQTDVYAEAQDIAEKLDLLSEEEQGLVDVSKLESLFEYFNGMTEVLADTITISPGGTISPGNNVAITSGGTYKVAGGIYTAPYRSGVINIDTKEKVTLEITGAINVNGENARYFIYVHSDCQKLTIINNQNYTVNVNNCQVLCNGNKDAIVTFEQGTYTASCTRDGVAMIYNAGVINFNNVTFHTTDQEEEIGCGVIVLNNYPQIGMGRINIYDGTILKNEYTHSLGTAAAIAGGTVDMHGGTITTINPGGTGIEADRVNFVGGTIENFSDGIQVDSSSSTLSIGENATFKNNINDIRLEKGAIFTIKDDFKETVSVIADNADIKRFPRQITTSETSPDMRARITCAYGSYSVNYDTTGKYLYFGDHVHSWKYSPSMNKIIATCTAKEDCEFNPDRLDLTLTATDEYYSGKAYTGATVTNNITYATGDEASIVYYLKNGALTNSSNSGAASEGAAPVNPGDYTVKVTLGGQTISADFKIRIEINPTVTIDGWTYGQKANTPEVTVKSGGSDITTSYKESQITYTYYTDENCTEATTMANGAATDGAVPKNAGTYYVKAEVAENRDYAADSAIAKFTIEKANPELNVSAVSDKNYGEGSFNLEVSNKGDGTKFYESSNDKVVTVDENGKVTIVGAGEATLTVSLRESTNYISDRKSVTVNVKKIDHSLVVDNLEYEVTYGDSAFKIKANLGDTESVIRFISDNENVATVSEDGTVTIKNAGTARITLSMEDSQNYLAVSKTVTVTVAPKKITVTPDDASKVYGEKDGKLFYHADDLVDGDSLSGIVLTRTEGENAGDYDITAEQENGANPNYSVNFNKGTFKINPKEITVAITPNGGTYEETITPAAAVLNDLVGEDKPEIILTYTGKANDGTMVNGTEKPTLAGIYTVTASITDSNYRLKSEGAAAEFIVTKASPGLSVAAISEKNYGDEAFKLEVKHKGDGSKTYASSNEMVAKVDESGTVTVVGTGTATLTVSLAESANYTADQKKVTITVKKINHSLAVDGIDYEVTYGDPAFKIAANAEDTESGIRFTSDNENVVTVSADGTVTIKNVGTAKITVSMEESRNYLAVSKEVTIKVAPKEITATLTPNGGTYEGTITPATPVLNGLVGADKPELTLTYTGTANDGTKINGTQVPSLAGTYTVTASITDSNYTLKPEGATAEFVIAKAAPALNVSPVADKIYGDKAFKLEVSHKGNGVKTYASSNDKVAKIDENGTVTITGAGTATLTISLAESANYTADRKSITVTVMPKEITVTADNQKKILGEADPVLTYTTDGLVGADTLSGITLERKAGEKVGTYAVTASQAAGANPNYKITFKKGTFTIQQADQSRMKGKYVYSLRLPSFFAKGKAKKSSVALSWKKYAGADGYDVFWRYCDGSINYERAGTVKNGKLSMTHKKLKNNHEYKYFIAAYKMVEGRKIYIAKSNGIHVAMKQASRTNAVSIKVNRTKVTLKAGKTFKLKCEVKPENSQKKLLSHSSIYSLSTSNSRIATVNKNGVIEAKAKGTCSIYVLANNGVYKRVKVTVK